MNKLRTTVVAAAALSCALAGAAGAQHAIPHNVVGTGGGVSTGGGLYLNGTVGQAAIGVSTVPGSEVDAGFWPVVDRLHIGPTSAVAIAAFRAAVSGHTVRLAWEISSAEGLVGFHVYRAEGEEAPLARVAATLLPADGEFAYTDEEVRPSTTYRYRLGAVDADGEFLSNVVTVRTPPGETELHQNYPNPFNPATTISFYVPDVSHVRLVVYDAAGRRVRTLADATYGYGRHEVAWDGTNDEGQSVGSGIYFYRLVAGKKTITKKLTLLK